MNVTTIGESATMSPENLWNPEDSRFLAIGLNRQRPIGVRNRLRTSEVINSVAYRIVDHMIHTGVERRVSRTAGQRRGIDAATDRLMNG
jgi:hypothetical protein